MTWIDKAKEFIEEDVLKYPEDYVKLKNKPKKFRRFYKEKILTQGYLEESIYDFGYAIKKAKEECKESEKILLDYAESVFNKNYTPFKLFKRRVKDLILISLFLLFILTMLNFIAGFILGALFR